jgi:hypothetical protein
VLPVNNYLPRTHFGTYRFYSVLTRKIRLAESSRPRNINVLSDFVHISRISLSVRPAWSLFERPDLVQPACQIRTSVAPPVESLSITGTLLLVLSQLLIFMTCIFMLHSKIFVGKPLDFCLYQPLVAQFTLNKIHLP